MAHKAIEQVLQRAEQAKADSDFTYFFALLGAAEALAKTMVLSVVASIGNDKDRHRYRLEHQLVRASGIGEWSQVIEDALTGSASQFLLVNAGEVKVELTRTCKAGEWQHDASKALKDALDHFGIEAEELPVKSDMKRWFRLFATLRNKTKAHGAPKPSMCGDGANLLKRSIDLVYANFSLFNCPWVYLHRNINGKYRVSAIAGDDAPFAKLRTSRDFSLPDGVYIDMAGPRRINLMHSDAELIDFFFANGGFTTKSFELLSYYTDNKATGDSSEFLSPPGVLPGSETDGYGELRARGSTFSNAPEVIKDYVARPALEKQLRDLLLDDRRLIVTLHGRGGIGKTSLALKVIHELFNLEKYTAIVWLSARDIDLQQHGAKPVRPVVVGPDDMSKLYASLVLSQDQYKTIKARPYFEGQLEKCDLGPCLFIFDNFETTQNPVEVFTWIDAFVRPPNKILITTRLHDFKGDYWVEVKGMEEAETRQLIQRTAQSLGVEHLLTESYVTDLIRQSEGHPYVIKVLLGEVAKLNRAANIPQLVAGTDDILTALFERTYSSLTPCAQRAFLTLCGWNSPVPRLVLQAVLIQATNERTEVENGVDLLIRYSMAEAHRAQVDDQEFISLPLVASTFGRKKLNIHPAKSSIERDVEILQMLGASQRGDVHLALATRLEQFLKNISKKIDKGGSFDTYAPVLEAVCRAYNPGWLLLARWHMEQRTPDGYARAKDELNRFLENGPPERDAALAWWILAEACYQTKDLLGEVHALINRSQISSVPFSDVSSTANRFNLYLKQQSVDLDRELKRDYVERLAGAMAARVAEADPDDLSRMAWLAIHLQNDSDAREYVKRGLSMEPTNYHLINLADRLGVPVPRTVED